MAGSLTWGVDRAFSVNSDYVPRTRLEKLHVYGGPSLNDQGFNFPRMASLAEGEAVALSTRIYFGRLAVHLLPRCWVLCLSHSGVPDCDASLMSQPNLFHTLLTMFLRCDLIHA